MDLLTPNVGLIFWQTVVFSLLIFLLAKVAWKPILRSLKEREKCIQDSLDSAEKIKQEMEEWKENNKKLLQEARKERDEILQEARVAATQLYSQVEVDAKKNAEKIISDAKALIITAQQTVQHDIRVQIATFSLELAEKLIKKTISEDNAQKQLVKNFIDELKLN